MYTQLCVHVCVVYNSSIVNTNDERLREGTAGIRTAENKKINMGEVFSTPSEQMCTQHKISI